MYVAQSGEGLRIEPGGQFSTIVLGPGGTAGHPHEEHLLWIVPQDAGHPYMKEISENLRSVHKKELTIIL